MSVADGRQYWMVTLRSNAARAMPAYQRSAAPTSPKHDAQPWKFLSRKSTSYVLNLLLVCCRPRSNSSAKNLYESSGTGSLVPWNCVDSKVRNLVWYLSLKKGV